MPIALKVKDAMNKNVFSIDSDATVDDAVRKMVQKNVWSLIVMKGGRPESVVTERGIIRDCLGKGLSPAKTNVGTIASTPLVTVGPDATIRDAMDIMTLKDVRRLFVVEKGKIIGRVTQIDLFQSTLTLLETLSELPDEL